MTWASHPHFQKLQRNTMLISPPRWDAGRRPEGHALKTRHTRTHIYPICSSLFITSCPHPLTVGWTWLQESMGEISNKISAFRWAVTPRPPPSLHDQASSCYFSHCLLTSDILIKQPEESEQLIHQSISVDHYALKKTMMKGETFRGQRRCVLQMKSLLKKLWLKRMNWLI